MMPSVTGFRIADSRSVGVILTAAIVVVAPGCGRRPSEIPLFPVSGSVLIDGKPLVKGYLLMEGEADAANGLVPVGADITNGSYTMKARAGRMRVRVMAPEEYGVEDATGERPTRETVAEVFNRNSQLFVEVMPNDDNHFDFEVRKR